MVNKSPLIVAGTSGAFSVALGALGAHALKNQLNSGLITPDQLNAFDTAARYQMYHTLIIVAIAVLNPQKESKPLNWAYYFFVTGIILFSGSLYLLSTRGLLGAEWLKMLGPITPLGGLFFMAGWLLLAFGFIKKR